MKGAMRGLDRCCVIGPHSSGTRLMSRVARAGFEHHGYEIYHRSLPGSWPTRGARFIWIERDSHATMCSQIVNGHAKDPREAHGNLVEAKEQLHLHLSQGMNLLTVHYTALVADPQQVIDSIAAWLEVPPWRFDEEIYDGDAQYRDMNLSEVKPSSAVGAMVRGGPLGPGASVGIGIPPVRATGNA